MRVSAIPLVTHYTHRLSTLPVRAHPETRNPVQFASHTPCDSHVQIEQFSRMMSWEFPTTMHVLRPRSPQNLGTSWVVP